MYREQNWSLPPQSSTINASCVLREITLDTNGSILRVFSQTHKQEIHVYSNLNNDFICKVGQTV